MTGYNIVTQTDEATVVAEYNPEYGSRPEKYQSEADLEKEFIELLISQGYEYVQIHSEAALIKNLRTQLEILNDYKFTEKEWDRFFKESIAKSQEGIVEKTRKIQTDHVQLLARDDGSIKNIYLLDKVSIHNNRLQVINQYEEEGGKHKVRYDVTILVNGLPLVHIELKRRGVAIEEAFNQIKRYERDSFFASSGLYEYIQVFVISNGTRTKYYSNTTRDAHVKNQQGGQTSRKSKTSNSFEFTSFWADANNKTIPDLMDFTKTFFAKHTILNVLLKYCVFTSEDLLLVMRPYQIAATEKIISRINIAHQYKWAGSIKAGGYIWHTTGSGKTLTSFKTAQIAANLPFVDKVLFIVDRKDLDYQTMKEYDRFEKGAANGNKSTRILQRQLENKNAAGGHQESRIIITTIQKLDQFIKKNKDHEIYKKHVVLIFDECHRSQFGDMHRAIVKHFKKYNLFGFTGTPILTANASPGGNPLFKTTEQVFGEKLHVYSIVDAINDRNVLPFKVDFINTIKLPEDIKDKQVLAIDREKALADPRRITNNVTYILEHFDQKTRRDQGSYIHTAKWDEKDDMGRLVERKEARRLKGFNAIFATASIPLAIQYYSEFKKHKHNLNVAIIYSFAPNEEEIDGNLADEGFEFDEMDPSSRDFLDRAIGDYNKTFKTNFDTSADKFQNYYKDVSQRMKNREIDLLIVVNMFLTGFDATTLNTLWVDKNLRMHGLLQAFSRTNRILNKVKTFGNIVCFRDLKEEMDESIGIFGNKDAGGIVLLKSYEEYFTAYRELIDKITGEFALGQEIIGEENKKEFIKLFGAILRLRNILIAFDEFEGNWILTPRDLQDYQSIYIDFYHEFRPIVEGDKEVINDDIVFEMELVRQVEVNIDYILMLIEKYVKSGCKDKDIVISIDKAIDSSVELRSKKKLIEDFVAKVNADSVVDSQWQEYLSRKKEEDLEALIAEGNLKSEETKKFMANSFRDGYVKTTGTDLDKILPPMSRFGGSNRQARKLTIIEKLMAYFEKYFGL